MALTKGPSEREDFHPASHWGEQQRQFEERKTLYWQNTRNLWERCHYLHKLTDSFEQERRLYEQQRIWFWHELLEQWQEKHEPARYALKQRMQLNQNFSDNLLDQQQSFSITTRIFQERLAALREQRAIVMELIDPTQRQEGYRQLQAAYLELQQELRENRQLLHEQQHSDAPSQAQLQTNSRSNA